MATPPDTKSGEVGKSQSTTATTTVVGEHEHTIVGYGLIKGIGDGEPIASERFVVGGHEWVLLFYPDGKRSSSSEGHLPPAPPRHAGPMPGPQPPAAGPPPPGPAGGNNNGAGVPPAGLHEGDGDGDMRHLYGNQMMHGHQIPQQAAVPFANPPNLAPRAPREATNDYAALFVALIGEGPNPQGVVSTSEGKVVRAFHRFTLVDQSPKDGEQPRHLSKGRRRDQGAVKISCARQDPNARNCHGYRKFVKRSVLENPANGYLKDDTIIIRYTIELVVSSGGALSRGNANLTSGPAISASAISVPPPMLGRNLAELLDSQEGADVIFKVENQIFKGHRIILTTRSRVFKALLSSGMREDEEGEVVIHDVRAPVFKTLLHFVYADALPEEHEGLNLEVAMAQHLLVAADQYELSRLRCICEQRLCETVDEVTVATTLTLAEQNHAAELKRVCLEFISSSDKLAEVMASEGFQHMVKSCPHLQVEILQHIANRRRHAPLMPRAKHQHHTYAREDGRGRIREVPDPAPLEAGEDAAGRRVRQRRE
mmetsp:Transcript_26845/g.67519  ORF Transcript_26845/g.67519 Transcript_26845/m.67519 type:complete len:540 (-) Transcript_26845:1476-3095(-)